MCIPKTPGHQIAIQPAPHFHPFPKSEHSAFSSAEFIDFLTDKQIEALHICGFLAEHCVRETALDGLKRRYAIRLIADCIASGDNRMEKRLAVLEELKNLGCILV